MSSAGSVSPGQRPAFVLSPGLNGGRLTAADVLSSAEVAALLHVPTSTVSDWARRGVIPSRKIGRRRIYVRQQIEALVLGR
ncbi:MAG: helix-turn-helix domain-containing protein [Solirubrobacteraceae bacterium]